MSSKTQFGKTREEWIALWEDGDWGKLVGATLVTIATCEHAKPGDRMEAIAAFGALVGLEIVQFRESDFGYRSLPEILRDVQFSIVKGRTCPLDKDVRQDMTERLLGCKACVDAVMQFKGIGDESLLAPPAVAADLGAN